MRYCAASRVLRVLKSSAGAIMAPIPGSFSPMSGPERVAAVNTGSGATIRKSSATHKAIQKRRTNISVRLGEAICSTLSQEPRPLC